MSVGFEGRTGLGAITGLGAGSDGGPSGARAGGPSLVGLEGSTGAVSAGMLLGFAGAVGFVGVLGLAGADGFVGVEGFVGVVGLAGALGDAWLMAFLVGVLARSPADRSDTDFRETPPAPIMAMERRFIGSPAPSMTRGAAAAAGSGSSLGGPARYFFASSPCAFLNTNLNAASPLHSDIVFSTSAAGSSKRTSFLSFTSQIP
mmetsp:Transcript_12728/g.50849  ORF Transcript_12728/g.50849 Transcript_12728/m.50849 type:complete len:203 (-) Transcript_12728:1024-1632(-)